MSYQQQTCGICGKYLDYHNSSSSMIQGYCNQCSLTGGNNNWPKPLVPVIPQVDSKDEEIKNCKKMIEVLKKRLVECENGAKIQEHQLTTVRQRNAQLVEQDRRSKEEKKIDLQRIMTLEKEMSRMQAEIEQFRIQRSDTTARIRSLQDELKSERLKRATNQIPSVGGMNTVLKIENDNLKQQIDGLKLQVQENEENMKVILNSVGGSGNVQSPISEMMKKLSAANDRNQMLEKATKALRTANNNQIVALRNKISEIEAVRVSERAASQEKVNMLRLKLSEMENRFSGRRQDDYKIKAMEEKMRAYEEKIAKLSMMNNVLKQQLEKLLQKSQESRSEKEEADENNLFLCKIVRNLKDSVMVLKEENNNLKNKNPGADY